MSDIALTFLVMGQEIIIVRRKSDGLLGLVGGKINNDEHPTDAIIREVKEEVGLVATGETRFLGELNDIPNNRKIFLYVTTTMTEPIINKDEILSWTFLSNLLPTDSDNFDSSRMWEKTHVLKDESYEAKILKTRFVEPDLTARIFAFAICGIVHRKLLEIDNHIIEHLVYMMYRFYEGCPCDDVFSGSLFRYRKETQGAGRIYMIDNLNFAIIFKEHIYCIGAMSMPALEAWLDGYNIGYEQAYG